jgi:hypothetical protein
MLLWARIFFVYEQIEACIVNVKVLSCRQQTLSTEVLQVVLGNREVGAGQGGGGGRAVVKFLYSGCLSALSTFVKLYKKCQVFVP